MKQIPIKLGPLALLLTVITICLTVLTMLTFSTATADKAMADRYAASVETRCELDQKGQRFLMEADDALAVGQSLASLEGVEEENGLYQKTFSKNGYTLTISLRPEGGQCHVEDWNLSRHWETKEKKNKLWLG